MKTIYRDRGSCPRHYDASDAALTASVFTFEAAAFIVRVAAGPLVETGARAVAHIVNAEPRRCITAII
jgi:hypothetical protein